MIHSILCYVPSSVKCVGPMTTPLFTPGSTTLQFLNHGPRHPRFQARLTPCSKFYNYYETNVIFKHSRIIPGAILKISSSCELIKHTTTCNVLGKWRPFWTPSWISYKALNLLSRTFSMLFYSYSQSYLENFSLLSAISSIQLMIF